MKIIFYISINNEKTNRIFRELKVSCPDIELELHRSVDRLERRIRQPHRGIALVLLVVSTPDEVDDLIALKERLHNLSTILIIQNLKEDAAQKLRLLRPRFIFDTDDNPRHFGLVLKKMVARFDGDGSKHQRIKAV